MKQNKVRYLLNLLLFIALSCFNTQLIPFLKEVGYTQLERGYILAANAFFSIILQVVFGYLCDHYQTMKKFFYLGYASFLIAGGTMFFYSEKEFFLHLFLTSMMAAMVKVLTALIETWMLYLDEKQFGKYRALGALGLCVGSPLAGALIGWYSYTSVIICTLIVSAAVFYFAFCCDEVSFESSVDLKKMLGLLKNKEYVYMIFIYFLIYMVGTADQYVVIDKMMELKADAFMVGVKWAVQSLLEIPFFIYAAKLLKKYSPYLLLKMGILMYGIKFLLYGYANTVWFIIIVTCLQIVTLPVIAFTSKIILDELTPQLKASSQMLAMAVFIGGSALVTPLITSPLVEWIGFDATLYAFGIFSVVPFLLVMFKKYILKK